MQTVVIVLYSGIRCELDRRTVEIDPLDGYISMAKIAEACTDWLLNDGDRISIEIDAG